MKKSWIIFALLFSLSTPAKKAKEKELKPLEGITFLISQIDKSDSFYEELLSGFTKFKNDGLVNKVNVIPYNFNLETFKREFQKALDHNDAIITDLLGVDNVEYYAQIMNKKNLPLVFSFVKPKEEIFTKYPNVFYISQDEWQSGVTQGLLASEYVRKHPEVDKNKDGYLNIFNMSGLGYRRDGDEWQRFKWQMNTIDNYPGNKFKSREIDNFPAFYNSDNARKYMEKLLAEDDKIREFEVIFSQSENMAHVMVEALRNTPYNQIPIFSRGRTEQGIQYMREGKIMGTTYSDPSLITYYASRMAYNYVHKLPINTKIPYLVYKHKIELPYQPIAAEQVQ